MAKRDDALTRDDLELRIRMLLPEVYQDCYDEIRPVSMGSAGLKYDNEGRVAWDEIWGSFCDLAMAGGPPHRGTLLEPGSVGEIEADPTRYEQVVREICRGISMVTGLSAERGSLPGWIEVTCKTDAMAGWLTRAIVTENVSARFDCRVLSLPAGPWYRVEKEIKNVITAVAKTCHYWLEHTSSSQRQVIANLMTRMELDSPLIQPAFPPNEVGDDHARGVASALEKVIGEAIGFGQVKIARGGWLGLDTPSVEIAVSMMRMLLAGNVLSRREGTMVFVPLNRESDPGGERVVRGVENVHRVLAPARASTGA